MLHQRARVGQVAAPGGGPAALLQAKSEQNNDYTKVITVDFDSPTQAGATLVYGWQCRTQESTRFLASITDDAGNTGWAQVGRNICINLYAMEWWECINANGGVTTLTIESNENTARNSILYELGPSTREAFGEKVVNTTSHNTAEHADPPLTSVGGALGLAIMSFQSSPSSKTDPPGWISTPTGSTSRSAYHRSEPVQFVNETAQVTNLGISREYQAMMAFYIA